MFSSGSLQTLPASCRRFSHTNELPCSASATYHGRSNSALIPAARGATPEDQARVCRGLGFSSGRPQRAKQAPRAAPAALRPAGAAALNLLAYRLHVELRPSKCVVRTTRLLCNCVHTAGSCVLMQRLTAKLVVTRVAGLVLSVAAGFLLVKS